MASLDDFDISGFTGGAVAEERWLNQRQGVLRTVATQWRPDLVVHDLSSVDGSARSPRHADVPAVAHLWGLVADAEAEEGMELPAPR